MRMYKAVYVFFGHVGVALPLQSAWEITDPATRQCGTRGGGINSSSLMDGINFFMFIQLP